MIKVPKYHPPLNARYADNPFITVLPPLNKDKLSRLMTSLPAFNPEHRSHEGEVRIQYVMGMAEYFVPMDHQVDFAWNLWSLLCEGYRRRYAEAGDESLAFSLLCESIENDECAPASMKKVIEAPWCSTLIGTPGVGKSCTVEGLLKRIGLDLFHHEQHGDVYQLMSLTVQPAKNSTGKALAKQIFLELRGYALQTGHVVPFATGKPPDTEAALLIAIEEFAKKLNLGMLVIDEVQHLFRSTGAMDEEAMKFLTSVINKLKIPMLMVGTWPCLALLGLEARLARRSYSPGSGFFTRMPNDESFVEFLEPLFAMQYVRNPVELTPEFVQRMYHHTQGVQDIVVKLFSMVQIEAISSDVETITLELLDAVALKHIPVIAPWIQKMRLGASESDIRIYDDEPVDVNKYIRSFSSTASTRSSRRAFIKRCPDINAEAKVQQIAAALVAAHLANERDAAILADAGVEATPKTPAGDILQRIIEEIRPKAPRPTRSARPKHKAAVAQQFNELDEDDIRRIAFNATQEQSEVGQALQQAGYLKLCTEDART